MTSRAPLSPSRRHPGIVNSARTSTLKLPAVLAGALAAALVLAAPFTVRAGEIRVAVAANFMLPMKRGLIPAFERDTGHTVVATYGPTGGLYAQITNGAPYAAFLSADTDRPRKLEEAGLGVPGSRFTFAVGKVVLWSPTAGLVDDRGDVLRTGEFQHIALPNPKIAPYGAAAQQALANLGLWDKLEAKVVYGQDLNQTYQMIASGNAELGFVALSQLKAEHPGAKVWEPPANLHAPIEQQAILLARAKEDPGARAFLAFLSSARGKALIASYGYGVE